MRPRGRLRPWLVRCPRHPNPFPCVPTTSPSPTSAPRSLTLPQQPNYPTPNLATPTTTPPTQARRGPNPPPHPPTPQHGEALSSCSLLRGVNAKFIDALLCAAQVETYMPRVDMLADGGGRPFFGGGFGGLGVWGFRGGAWTCWRTGVGGPMGGVGGVCCSSGAQPKPSRPRTVETASNTTPSKQEERNPTAHIWPQKLPHHACHPPPPNTTPAAKLHNTNRPPNPHPKPPTAPPTP